MKIIQEVVSLFFIYSFFGWILEVIYVSILNRRFTDRGFLIEPICPIYGVSCVAMTYLLKGISKNYLLVFIVSMLLCTTIEYLTGLIMEKTFKTKWWDYSRFKYNIQGRICLRNTIVFGILGTLVVAIVSPYMQNLLTNIPNKLMSIILIILICIFIVDFIVSSIIIHKIKVKANNVKRNSKKALNEQVREYLINESIFYKRVMRAFPDFKLLVKRRRK